MPIHFDDRDVVSEVAGSSSALIVPCNMCPAITVAVREKKPFLRLFRNPLRSAPFEGYLKALQARLGERGVSTTIFRSPSPHQWFMCMWTSRKRKQLRERVQGHDAVIVLGCKSATETVRAVVPSNGCKVIEGMEVSGIMNAQLRLTFPGDISFANCKTVPMSA